tara:strand:+ start:78 stop:311 length:234 start_codon:yes stop_codon:yes gene_type:complete
MKLEAKNQKQANLFIKWICLNECNFWGNDEAVIAHKRILRSCRQSVARALGMKPTEVPSEALDLYKGNEEFCKNIKA